MRFKAILCAALLVGTLALTTACGAQTQTAQTIENVEYTKISDKGVSLPKELSETNIQYAPFPVAVNGDLYFYTMLPYRSSGTRSNVYGNLEEVPSIDYRIYKVNKEGVFVSEQSFVADGVDKETLKQETGTSLGGFTQSGTNLYWYNEVYKTLYRYDTAAQKIEPLPIQNVVNYLVVDDVVFYQPYDPASLPDKEKFAPGTTSGDSGDVDGEKFIEIYAYGIESNLPWKKYENGKVANAFSDEKMQPVWIEGSELYYRTGDGKMIRKYNVQTGEDTEFKENFVDALKGAVVSASDSEWVVTEGDKLVLYDVTKDTPQRKELSGWDNMVFLCMGDGKIFATDFIEEHIYSYQLKTGKRTAICDFKDQESDVMGAYVVDTWLYYADWNYNLWRVPQDGSKEPEKLLEFPEKELWRTAEEPEASEETAPKEPIKKDVTEITKQAEVLQLTDKGIKLTGTPVEREYTPFLFRPSLSRVGDTLYYGMQSTYDPDTTKGEESTVQQYMFYKISEDGISVMIDRPSSEIKKGDGGFPAEKDLCIDGNRLYYYSEDGATENDYTVKKGDLMEYDMERQTVRNVPIPEQVTNQFFVKNGVIYCAVDCGGFDYLYRKYENDTLSPAFSDEDGYALFIKGDTVYYLSEKDQMIRTYDMKTGKENDYKKYFFDDDIEQGYEAITGKYWIMWQYGPVDKTVEREEIEEEAYEDDEASQIVAYDIGEEIPKGRVICQGDAISFLDAWNEKLYLKREKNDGKDQYEIFEKDIKTGKEKLICKGEFYKGYVLDDTWLYLTDGEDNLWRVPQDGSKEPEEILHLRDSEDDELTEY